MLSGEIIPLQEARSEVEKAKWEDAACNSKLLTFDSVIPPRHSQKKAQFQFLPIVVNRRNLERFVKLHSTCKINLPESSPFLENGEVYVYHHWIKCVSGLVLGIMLWLNQFIQYTFISNEKNYKENYHLNRWSHFCIIGGKRESTLLRNLGIDGGRYHSLGP